MSCLSKVRLNQKIPDWYTIFSPRSLLKNCLYCWYVPIAYLASLYICSVAEGSCIVPSWICDEGPESWVLDAPWITNSGMTPSGTSSVNHNKRWQHVCQEQNILDSFNCIMLRWLLGWLTVPSVLKLTGPDMVQPSVCLSHTINSPQTTFSTPFPVSHCKYQCYK